MLLSQAGQARETQRPVPFRSKHIRTSWERGVHAQTLLTLPDTEEIEEMHPPSGTAHVSEATKRRHKRTSPPAHLHPSFSCVLVKAAREGTCKIAVWISFEGYVFLVLSGGWASQFPEESGPLTCHPSPWRTTRPARNPAGRSQAEHFVIESFLDPSDPSPSSSSTQHHLLPALFS